MTIRMKLNKPDVRGIRRSIASLDMVDLYSMSASSLIALDFLKRTKARHVAINMGYQLMALKTLLRSAMGKRSAGARRLDVGTAFWGPKSQIPQEIRDDPDFIELVGDMKDAISLIGTQLK